MTSAALPPLPEPITFASELIKARTERGLTQSALAQRSGLSLSAIKAYEAGRNLPGARELRELCQALQVSPNKLLFGTEEPFKDSAPALDMPAENEHVRAARVAALMALLSQNESASIATLVHALTIARHGEEKVREVLLSTDLMVGMMREVVSQGNETLATGAAPNPSNVGTNLEAFMDRQGHVPGPQKDTKKTS